MARDQHADRDAVRITTASASRNEDIAHRQRRYVISMAIRTVCFVGAIVVGDGWLRWVLIVAAVLLPYVAVVMANAASSKSDDFTLRDAVLHLGREHREVARLRDRFQHALVEERVHVRLAAAERGAIGARGRQDHAVLGL